MEWYQFLMLALGLYAMHRENSKNIKELNTEMKSFHIAVKDFHGRLCTLEQKYIDMMERFMQSQEKK